MTYRGHRIGSVKGDNAAGALKTARRWYKGVSAVTLKHHEQGGGGTYNVFSKKYKTQVPKR